MPPVVVPRRRQWSVGFIILVSTMVGIFSLVIGILVISIRPELIHKLQFGYDHASFVSQLTVGGPLQEGLEWFRQGNIANAKRSFSSSECKESLCNYYKKELDFFDSDFDLSIIKDSLPTESDPDHQYLYAIMVSNRFDNLTQYTSPTFPLSVLYMYAASTAGHPGALMAMGYRHLHGYGVPKRCETAALNYLEVAKPVANIYANSVPKAVELVRLGIEKDKKVLSIPEISLFTEVANTNPEISLAVGKRFLLGTDGFPQDYSQAFRFLLLATGGPPTVAPGAFALLGYMHALGLGVDADVEKAEDFFNKGLMDGLGMNGLGFIRFRQERFTEAYGLFNQSASAGSSDGMFNLASVYLTGTGVAQNFQKAFMWFTEALRRGHTPAGYALAVMHLNGIGTIRDCGVAVSLLKEVAERGEFVSQTLRAAHAMLEDDETKDLAVLQLLKLAEAGHTVSQENLAHLIDSGKAGGTIFYFNSGDELKRQIYAQRFYEMAANQGSVTSELRLGDYAYYGWGLKADFSEDESQTGLVDIIHRINEPDFQTARERYAKARDDATKVASLTGGTIYWLNKVIGTASFNIGYMHHFGVGTRPNKYEASKHYRRAIAKDSHGAWILDYLIDWFVYPREPEQIVPVQTAKTDQPSEPSLVNTVVERLRHVFRDRRIVWIVGLVSMLIAVITIRHVIPV